jgi:hypothetical protein
MLWIRLDSSEISPGVFCAGWCPKSASNRAIGSPGYSKCSWL